MNSIPVALSLKFTDIIDLNQTKQGALQRSMQCALFLFFHFVLMWLLLNPQPFQSQHGLQLEGGYADVLVHCQLRVVGCDFCECDLEEVESSH